jgi:hypothetical protein
LDDVHSPSERVAPFEGERRDWAAVVAVGVRLAVVGDARAKSDEREWDERSDGS